MKYWSSPQVCWKWPKNQSAAEHCRHKKKLKSTLPLHAYWSFFTKNPAIIKISVAFLRGKVREEMASPWSRHHDTSSAAAVREDGCVDGGFWWSSSGCGCGEFDCDRCPHSTRTRLCFVRRFWNQTLTWRSFASSSTKRARRRPARLPPSSARKRHTDRANILGETETIRLCIDHLSARAAIYRYNDTWTM